MRELARRGSGSRESGAFLLGQVDRRGRREVQRFAYYDDLDPHALDTGIVVFHASGYSALWRLCEETGLAVVADVHTHPHGARQSEPDRKNPMIAQRGHVAVIVPDFAQRVTRGPELGIYEYQGAHQWTDYSGDEAETYFYIGFWG
jgi:proteasome lid subunit RPN8/RPN11